MKKDLFFELKDPLDRIVRLAKERWYNHIIVNHPDMKPHYTKVKKTILDPQFIIESEKNTNLIYSSNQVTSGGLYVNVIVGFNESYGEGYVRTAHLTAMLLQGKLAWKKAK